MLEDRVYTFAYIPLFLALSVGFMFLLIFEFKAFWTGGEVTFNP